MRSLDSQRDTLTEWAEAEEWTVVAVYSDPGASGTSVDGGQQFRRMVAGGEAGEFDALLVLKFDRFARFRASCGRPGRRRVSDHRSC